MPQKQNSSPKVKRAKPRKPGFVPRIQGKRRRKEVFDPNNCFTDFRTMDGIGSVQERDRQAWERKQNQRHFREVHSTKALDDHNLLNLTGLAQTAALKFLSYSIEVEQAEVKKRNKTRSSIVWDMVIKELGDTGAVRKGCAVAKAALHNSFDATKAIVDAEFKSQRDQLAMAE